MQILFFKNAKLKAEVIDGEVIELFNLSGREQRNLSGHEPFPNGIMPRLALVYDYDGDGTEPTIDFDE